jgi:hypothetical protein
MVRRNDNAPAHAALSRWLERPILVPSTAAAAASASTAATVATAMNEDNDEDEKEDENMQLTVFCDSCGKARHVVNRAKCAGMTCFSNRQIVCAEVNEPTRNHRRDCVWGYIF